MNRPTAYSGDKPYIFISYAHKDANRIYPVIQALQNNGFRVWYDEGLEVGSHWSETIATHMDKSQCVLCFLTKNFFESENCKDEMHFAKERGKGPLIVYLDPVTLPVEMQMSFGRFHALSMDKLSGTDHLIREICRTDMLSPCKEGSISQPAKTSNEAVNAFFGLVRRLMEIKAFRIAVIALAVILVVTSCFGSGGSGKDAGETNPDQGQTTEVAGPNSESTGEPTTEPTTEPTEEVELLGSGECGTNITWTLTPEGVLTLSGTGKTDSTPYYNMWSEYASYINELVVEEGITAIGESLFYELPVLSKITLPNSLLELEDKAFFGCVSLKEIELPSSLVSLGDYVFSECANLTAIRIPGSVSTVGNRCFSGCSNLSEVIMEEGVLYIGTGAFEKCYKLSSVQIPEGLIEIGYYAFDGCSGLTEVYIPRSVMTVCGYAFKDCSRLTSVTINQNCEYEFIGGDGFPEDVEINFYEEE